MLSIDQIEVNDVADPNSDELLDWRLKGLPAEFMGLAAGAVDSRQMLLFDDRVLFPVAVLKESALRSNSAWMRAFTSATGVKLAPHGKTTMAPDLLRMQLEDGAWAITAATPHHVRAYRRFGVQRIFLANQIIGTGAIDAVLAELADAPEVEFFCLVDSIEGVHALHRGLQRTPLARPLQVLIEVGAEGGRAGVRNVEAGLKVASAIAASPGLKLIGVEAFEGVFQMAPRGLEKAQALLELLLLLAKELDRLQYLEGSIVLSAGGSGYFDVVCEVLSREPFSRPVEIILRSGCYLTHDNGIYDALFQVMRHRNKLVDELRPSLSPALEVWGQVQSIPEPDRFICSLGKRDVGTDAGMPVLIGWASTEDRRLRHAPPNCAVGAMNDQHTFLIAPQGAPFAIGDFVGFGVSHPCTTFDKWRALLRVDDEYRILGITRTYF